jgi:hypothetical protein
MYVEIKGDIDEKGKWAFEAKNLRTPHRASDTSSTEYNIHVFKCKALHQEPLL